MWPQLPGVVGTGLKPGENRLYIVEERAGYINVHPAIRTSPGYVHNANWRFRLPRMAQVYPQAFTGCEVHCHGISATLQLQPRVGTAGFSVPATPTEFGEALGPLLKPGSLIELLACEVASIGLKTWLRNALIDYAHGRQFAGFEDAILSNYPGGQSMRSEIANNLHEALDENPRYRMMLGQDWRNTFETMMTYWKAPSWRLHRAKQEDPVLGIRPYLRVEPTEIPWRRLFQLADFWDDANLLDGNGPRFCTALAKASNCVVRAGWIEQFQERNPIAGHDVKGDFRFIGDWEGYVFDFDGDGLKAVHYCLERPVSTQSWRGVALREAGGGNVHVA